MPREHAAWHGVAMFRAARILLQVGGIDLAGSLAYFTVLSLLPAVALFIMALAFFGDPEEGRGLLTAVLVYYFPSSADLIQAAVESLLQGSLAIGLVATASLVLGANGLFMAASRALNRVFGVEVQTVVHRTIVQVMTSTVLVVLFLLSVGLSASLHLAVRYSEGIAESIGGLSSVVVLTLSAASTLLPAFFTMVVFAFVYSHVPNVRVHWRDAVFGAIAAIVLFEAGKHLFFWFTTVAGQRNAVYGPIASFVVLLMWGYVAGMIFLYGAALARAVSELRPQRSPRRQR